MVFPGTGGKPRDYRKLADQAGALGLHALVLRYPNDTSINELAAGDPAAHLPLRLDHWDGAGRSGKVDLAPGETIEARLLAALRWLSRERAGEGWGTFLRDGALDWSRVAALGHSLGGGYAALLAKHHPLERCVLFAWADWNRADGRLADWVLSAPDWATPPAKRFWIGHERDEMVPRAVGEEMISVVVPAARSARVESDDPPWGRARVLWTDLEPSGEWPTGQPFHNSVVLDVETPRWPDGSCVLADLWTWTLVGRAV